MDRCTAFELGFNRERTVQDLQRLIHADLTRRPTFARSTSEPVRQQTAGSQVRVVAFAAL